MTAPDRESAVDLMRRAAPAASQQAISDGLSYIEYLRGLGLYSTQPVRAYNPFHRDVLPGIRAAALPPKH